MGVIKDKTKKKVTSNNSSKINRNNSELPKNTMWVEKRGDSANKADTKVTKKALEKNFEPSMKMLIRIMDSMTEKGSKSKTNLSRGANLNYTRLVKHVIWLEKKGLVKSTVENARIKVNLTEKGRIFAATITKS
ncbi:MAG: winged helix-turn-helix domain-containing protein [Nitrosarchaeum sp.]